MMERTLPIRVPIIPGESLDSWLETLARRNGLTVRELLQVLGWPVPRTRFSLVQGIPAETLRRMERQSGLASGRLDEAVLDQFLPLGWARDSGSQYCPHCLSERDGRWLLAWRLSWIFACSQHKVLLRGTCPACGHAPRRSAAATARRHAPATCPNPTGRGSYCGADLRIDNAPLLAPDDPLLATQRWTDALVSGRIRAAKTAEENARPMRKIRRQIGENQCGRPGQQDGHRQEG